MKKIVTKDKLDRFSSIIRSSPRIAILSHANPDGDAVGSGLALLRALRAMGCEKVRFIVPNHFPKFLSFVDPDRDVEIFSEAVTDCTAFIAAADTIIVADFNDTRRTERMGEAVERNISATRILVDHHIAPPAYDLDFHTTESSSTAFIVYNIIEGLGIKLDRAMGEALYMGMMTDTGGFSFGNLTGDLYRALGAMVDAGVDPVMINRQINNTQTEGRVRMVGYLIDNKMVVNTAHNAAYMTLTNEEKLRFNHQIGDTEGIVNIPLTIKGITFSAILVENLDHVKISLRSVGELDVNLICGKHFSGGGHKNAAGGKFFGSMENAILALQSVISTL